MLIQIVVVSGRAEIPHIQRLASLELLLGSSVRWLLVLHSSDVDHLVEIWLIRLLTLNLLLHHVHITLLHLHLLLHVGHLLRRHLHLRVSPLSSSHLIVVLHYYYNLSESVK